MHILESWDNFVREESGKLDPLVDQCALPPYLLTHFQVGVGASSVTEASTVKLLGKPLTEKQYGYHAARSVKINKYFVFQEEGVPLAEQWLSRYHNQGVVGSGLVTILVLDEDTANGNLLNEIGLFVRNPFVRTKEALSIPNPPKWPKLIGGPVPIPTDPPITIQVEDPGVILAAYRQFSPIQKESYFALLFRWSISFTQNC